MKTFNSPTWNLHFGGFLQSPKLIGLHNFSAVCCLQQRFKFFQEPFRIWILQAWSPAPHDCVAEGCKVDCPRSLHFKTIWAGKKSFKDFQDRFYIWVPAMSETPGNNLGPSDVQVHMNVNVCPNRQSQRSIYFMRKFTWTIMNVNTCPNRQPQRSIYFMRKFTWAWTHTPPHPNKTPWPSKGRGPTTFFTIYIYIYMNAIRIVAMVWVPPLLPGAALFSLQFSVQAGGIEAMDLPFLG
jgi:hypothetical protein